MIKYCVICGAPFEAPPSSKKVTCSPACRSKRAAIAAASGHKWSEAARLRRASTPAVQAHMAQLQAAGLSAALKLPEGQRGPQNRGSKTWVLIDPSGNTVGVVNLKDWARRNCALFEGEDAEPEKAAMRISTGFRAIASSMRGVKSRQRPVSSYKGWRLAELPKNKEDGND